MISLFRRFFDSKLGIPITLAFLALIAIAFTASDVGNTGTFGGIAGGDRVAIVGDAKIGTGELSRAASNAVDNLRQQDPTLTIQSFVADGRLDEVLDSLIDRYAVTEWAESHGLRAGDNLINSEILRIPGFLGADGEFDDEAYRAAIARAGLNDAQFRAQARQDLLSQQVFAPASFAAQVPDSIARRYAAVTKERRNGDIGFLEAARLRPSGDPTDEQLQEYYQANRQDFERPERRVIRYATFGLDALGDRARVTEAELRKRFEENQRRFAGQDERGYTQLIVPTEAAARSIRERVNAGGSFEQAAREAGFEVTRFEPARKAEVAERTSQAVAEAIFAAQRGGVSAPVRSDLGWVVARVDSVRALSGQTFEQARAGLRESMAEEKRRRAVNDLAVQIEEQVEDGASLADIAGDLNAEIRTTQPLTEDGRVYGGNGTAPQELARVLANAFLMDEGEPQLAELQAGEQFIVYDVGSITRAAIAPLAEVRREVTQAWRNAEGARLAGEAATRVLKRVEEGASLAAALRAEETAFPPIDQVSLTREQVEQLQQQGQSIPAPIALMFSMAEGSAKKLEGPENIGWFIIDLKDVEAGEIAADDPLVAVGKANLERFTGNEYVAQLRAAIRQEVGVERNDVAIEAVRRQLSGQQ